jgi:bis(5'-nucleosidyl)-tetraphosphatase
VAKIEKSCGAVIFRKDGSQFLFLLMYSHRNKIWGFPKGHIDSGESEIDTALREIKEETGLKDLMVINGFRKEDIYSCVSNREPYKGHRIEKHSIYFLCETKSKSIVVDNEEITKYKWLKTSEAKSLISFDGLKQILNEADTFLQGEMRCAT